MDDQLVEELIEEDLGATGERAAVDGPAPAAQDADPEELDADTDPRVQLATRVTPAADDDRTMPRVPAREAVLAAAGRYEEFDVAAPRVPPPPPPAAPARVVPIVAPVAASTAASDGVVVVRRAHIISDSPRTATAEAQRPVAVPRASIPRLPEAPAEVRVPPPVPVTSATVAPEPTSAPAPSIGGALPQRAPSPPIVKSAGTPSPAPTAAPVNSPNPPPVPPSPSPAPRVAPAQRLPGGAIPAVRPSLIEEALQDDAATAAPGPPSPPAKAEDVEVLIDDEPELPLPPARDDEPTSVLVREPAPVSEPGPRRSGAPPPPPDAGKGAKKPPPPPRGSRAEELTAVMSPPPAPPAPPAPPTPPPAQVAASSPARARPWWERFFSDDYLMSVLPPTQAQIARQVDFLESSLGLPRAGTVLDVGCGLGLHARELAQRGYLVVGLDLSLPMITRAAEDAQQQNLRINFLHTDIREIQFDGAFDGVICLGTTFGFFDDESNRDVLARLYQALRPGGRILVDVVNRDHVINNQPNLVWFQGDGCVCMEESDFNYFTSRLVVKRTMMHEDGQQSEAEYSVRLYSLHELGQLMQQMGFRVMEVSGQEATRGTFFGTQSQRILMLAERRSAQRMSTVLGAPERRVSEAPTPPPKRET